MIDRRMFIFTTPNTKNEITKKRGIELSSIALSIKALSKLDEYIKTSSDLKCTLKVQSTI